MRTDGSIRTSILDWASLVLVIIGGLAWGLVGLGELMNANWNVINLVFAGFPPVEALAYVLVGLAGLYELYFGYQLYGARTGEPTRERKAVQ